MSRRSREARINFEKRISSEGMRPKNSMQRFGSQRAAAAHLESLKNYFSVTRRLTIASCSPLLLILESNFLAVGITCTVKQHQRYCKRQS